MFSDKPSLISVVDSDKMKQKTFTCILCGFSSENKPLIKEHIQTHYCVQRDETSRPHKCSFCNFCSHSVRNLKLHLKTHTDVPKLKCIQCDFRTRLASTLKQHSLMHIGDAPYKCDLCDYGVYRLKNLEAHVNRVHHYEKPYKCDTCVYRATTKDILFKHVKRCSGIKVTLSPIKCISSKNNLEETNSNPIDSLNENSMSANNKAGSDRTYQNPECEEIESNTKASDTALVIVNIPPLVCNMCEFTFNEEHELNEHMSCHLGENNIVSQHDIDETQKGDMNVTSLKLCGICGFQTYEIMALQRHVFTNHLECIKCNHCNLTCGSVKELYSHNLTVHQTKYFFCKYCRYFCSEKSELDEHVSSHNKNFQCPKCDFQSKYKRQVQEHQFSHDKLKPYKCACCDFQSYRASNLIRHQYVHNSSKPLKCKDCSYSTTQKHCFNRHVQKHIENG